MDESVVRVFEEQRVGTLRLSAAIRTGAMLRPQNHDGLLVSPSGESCALGAAHEALCGTVSDSEEAYVALRRAFPALNTVHPNPVTGHSQQLIWVVTSLNDSGKWSREQIADWLQEQGL